MKKLLAMGLCCGVTVVAFAGVGNQTSLTKSAAKPTLSATGSSAPTLTATQQMIRDMKLRGEEIPQDLYQLALDESGYTPRPHENSSRQGGENMASALVITALPFTDNGTTAGTVNDYDAVCPYTGSTSPDVVFSYTPTASEVLSIDLCNSAYDTKLYVFQNTVNNVVACSDDFYFAAPCFVYSSFIEALTVTPGNTYYIIVDGYATASGAYSLEVSGGTCDPITCDGTAEVEPNDGPNGDPVVYGTIDCEETVCGETSTDDVAGTRDTDWYEILLLDDKVLTLDLDVDSFNGLLIVLDSNDNIIYTADNAGFCEDEVLETDCLQAGTYHIFVAHNAFTGVETANYGLTVSCETCVYESPCDGAPEIVCGGSYTGDTTGGINYVGNAAPDDFFVYESVEAATVTFTLCDGADWDTYLRVFDRCPTDAGAVELAFNDDGCGSLQSIITMPLEAGTYYLVVEGYSANFGAYSLDVTCSGPAEYGFCQDVDAPDGNWTFGTSEVDFNGANIYRMDRFGNAGDIWSVDFVGLALFNNGSWVACNENPMPFLINFYNTDQELVQAYTATLTGTPTGDLYAGVYESRAFTFDLPEPLPLEAGWIGIQGAGVNTCWFLWGSSTGADNASYLNNAGVISTEAFDLNYCLTFETAVDDDVQPATYTLGDAYPNPFNPVTTISYSIAQAAHVTLAVHNISGQEVAVLVDGQSSAGNHAVTFNAEKLASGVYTYTISSGEFTQTKSFTLVK